MKTHKKILLGLGSLIVVGGSGIFFFSEKASAFTVAELRSATYTIQSQSTLIANIGGTNYTFTDSNTSDTIRNWKPTGSTVGSPCVANSADSNVGINYVLDLNPPPNKGGSIVSLGEISGIGPGGRPICSSPISVASITLLNPSNITFGGGAQTPPAPAEDDTPSCENSDRLGLGWIFCKVLRGIDSAVTAFYDEVQDQLCVKVDTAVTVGGSPINSGTDGGIKCGNKENLFTAQLYEVWSNIRVIATSLLVILMLVAIIGQAVSGGKR